MYCAGVSDAGRRRPNNEDAWAIVPELGLLVVADGMGGHAAGEVASRLVVDAVTERLGALPAQADGVETLAALAAAVTAADQAVAAGVAADSSRQGMGAALTVAVIRHGFFHLAQVGDTRAYLLREGRLLRLTRDHTAVEDQVALGVLTATAAARSPHRHVLTRAVGAPGMAVDLYRGAWRSDDLLLLSSDGLHDRVDESAVQGILQAEGGRPEVAAQKLIAAANAAGGEDNITAVLAVGERFTGASAVGDETARIPVAAPLPPDPRQRRRLRRLVMALAVVVATCALNWLGSVRGVRWNMDAQPPTVAGGVSGRAPIAGYAAPDGFSPPELQSLLASLDDLGAWEDLAERRFRTPTAARIALHACVRHAVALAATLPPPTAADDAHQLAFIRLLSSAVRVATPFVADLPGLRPQIDMLQFTLARASLTVPRTPR
jgi:protein phosphatase